MDCLRASELLHGYLDGELDAAHVGEMEAHLAACAACRQDHDEYVSLRSLVQERAPRYPAPPHLRTRVQAALRSTQKARRVREWIPTGRIQFAGSLAAAILLSSVGTYYWVLSSNDDRAIDDVVDAHVRALVTNHVTDVASSDQHTVKPWFNGRLDFSPPVKDLAPKEFPLIGGRLDYVDGRQTAALLYRHHQHWISVFIWRDQTDGEGALKEFSKHGYGVAEWGQTGLRFHVVSDVASPELRRFVALLRTQDVPQ